VDGGARVLVARPPVQPLNASEAAASKNIDKGQYVAPSLDLKTYLVSLQDSYSTLRYGLLDYLMQNKAQARMLNPVVWERETNLNPIMAAILDFIFLEKIGKEPFDVNQVVTPQLHALGVPADVGIPLVHEVIMLVISTIGHVFPEMYFGPDVRISYDIVGGNDLCISTVRDFGE